MIKNIRKVLSYSMVFILLLNLFPGQLLLRAKASPVRTVTITNTYVNLTKSQKTIIIRDPEMSDLTNKRLLVGFSTGKFEPVPNIQIFEPDIIQAEINPEWNISMVRVTGNRSDGTLKTITYDEIDEGDLPKINDVVKHIVDQGEPIIARGPKLHELIGENYSVRVGGVPAIVGVDSIGETLSQIRLTSGGAGSFHQGEQDIIITYRRNNAPGTPNNYTLQNIHDYKRAVRIVGRLDLDGIRMFPTMGEPGSEIKFTRTNLGNYDVYFIRDLENPSFIEQNRATGVVLTPPNTPGGDTTLTATVPNVSVGPYHVVLTNRGDPNVRYVIPNQQFRVINIQEKPTLSSVQPNSAPSMTPTDVDIYGYYLSKHNVPGFTPDPNSQRSVQINNGRLTINYGTGNLKLSDQEDPYRVSVKKEFEIFIGNTLAVSEVDFIDENGIQRIRVRTVSEPLAEVATRDVIITMETTISAADNPAFNASMFREIVLPNAFRFLPATEVPVVTEVIPKIIPVEIVQGPDGDPVHYINRSLDELHLAIRGSRFLVTRFEDEDNRVVVNMPVINIGGEEIRMGHPALLSYEVLNNNVLVTGTDTNEIGNMIILKLKTGPGGLPIPKVENRHITINNPIRKSRSHADPRRFDDVVEFKLISQNDFPVIQSVEPNFVAVEGGDEVVILGSNLRTGAKVFIENREVTGVNISGDNTRITFRAPRGTRPTNTQLQVVNPNGGIATYPFIYTTTYTQPRFTLINPTEGTEGTIVTAKGESFLRPDPTVVTDNIGSLGGAEIYRLIGTRVLLDGKDINEYNIAGNHIRLTPFHNNNEEGVSRNVKDNIFEWRTAINELEIGEGFRNTILFNDATKKLYAITRNHRNELFIEDGLGNNFKIEYVGDEKYQAVLGGTVYPISFPDKGKINIGDILELTAYTPYLVERKADGYDYITGNRVQFIDSRTLLFTVPDLSRSPWTGDGLYDVTIINPDTKRQTLRNAFRYYGDPRIIPRVQNVIPHQGPDKGGNVITIINDPRPIRGLESRFEDYPDDRIRVFIGGQRVPNNNITVSPNGRELTVVVPPFLENIKNMGLDRITVPIVLVNPGGGSYNISYSEPLRVGSTAIRGYTYVVPTSNPAITRISPTSGPVNAGNMVEIFGRDFRDYDDGEILPEVFFGKNKAKIQHFSPGYLQVLVPPGTGTVDVFVINNDAGMSNKVKYTYRASTPTIRSVSPGVGNRMGGDLIEIEGTGFEEGKIKILTPSSTPIERTMPLVKVANRTNRNLRREDPNSGVIFGGTTVTLPGELTVNYIPNFSENNDRLTVTIRDRGKDYVQYFTGLGPEPVYINTRDLRHNEEPYPYEELIQVSVVENRLIVDGGYSPNTTLRSERQITARVPYYHTVGRVELHVINPDGGQAKANFEYRNPDSRPTITNILRDGREPELRNGTNTRVVKVNHKGGNVIDVIGADFREGARVQISNILTLNYPTVTLEGSTKLTFTMPSVPESQVGTLHRVIVLNEDGGVATSDSASPPIYIEFIKGESTPRIDRITPDKGPASGGTRVKIQGQDFRREMDGFEGNTLSVLFGGTRVEYSNNNNNIEFVDYRTIYVRVPASTNIGQVDVRLENPDGELSNPVGKFTYISKPVITNITPERLFRNDNQTEVVITGNSFMPGAKIVVGGRVIAEKDLKADMEVRGRGITGVNNAGENIDVAIVGGIEPASVTVQDKNTIVVKFNVTDKDLDSTNVIVINPDGGISDPYNNFRYEIPIPSRPLKLVAVPGYESTMKLIWSESDPAVLNASDRYEVYAKRSFDSQFSFVGVTRDAEFLIRDLLPGTLYNFRIRALNVHGAAVDFAEASAWTLNVNQDHKLRDKIQELEREERQQNREGKDEVVGDRVIRTIGIQEFPRIIDFSLSKYKDQNKYTVAIPVAIIANYPGDISIRDGEATFRFRPRDLNTREVMAVPANLRNDSYVRVNIEPVDSGVSSAIQRTQLQASRAYEISFELQAGRNITSINPTLREASLNLRFDSRAYPRVNAANIFTGRHNPSRNEFTPISQQQTANITERGRYMLVANR